MESPEERRQRLYGPMRNLQVEAIRQKLSKSCVLKDGEYNFTPEKLKDVNYGTSYDQDFSGAQPDPSNTQDPKGQLEHHFEHGNDSGGQIPNTVYKDSTTKADFTEKPWSKPEMITGSRVINWPDMAPRYMTSRKVENSEYSTSYIPGVFRSSSMPDFPRLNTSKLQLPIDQQRFKKRTNIQLGSDNPSIFSESQRVYGIGRKDGKTPHLAFSKTTSDTGQVSKAMKDLEKTSHVFRTGDYNGIVGKFQTTVNDEFGPRTLPPGEAAARLIKAAEKEKEKGEGEDSGIESSGSNTSLPDDVARTSHLAAYARSRTVPNVFKSAADGKDYQTSAHFHFGYDPFTVHTMYSKDFAPGSQAARNPPKQYPTPAAGRLLQNDPAFSNFGQSSNRIDYGCNMPQPLKNEEGKTQMEVNLGRRHTDNIIMSYDETRHTQDRQRSLAHSDYIGPPIGYKPLEQLPRHSVTFDYLTPDDALPYPPSDKMMSEAQNNYIGTFMDGSQATGRRLMKNVHCKQRLDDGRSTHFVVGYSPYDFTSETKIKYTGDPKNDHVIKPAGKTENVASVKFTPLYVSENTQDCKAADPHYADKNESLVARSSHYTPQREHAMRTSVMKADYKPFVQRRFTEAQVKTMIDCDKKVGKDIARSHLFHTDNSGRNNFQTTTMDDFIKPETMTGRKFLAAR